ncbi:MAG: hypothetical protein IKS83_09070 [Victivallales bacterium]|nr:hypothetical protein [Victivallales bacterium]
MLKLANLFVDGAVVQRDMPIAVWGWCAPRILVTATLGGSTATAPSALDGRFELRLPALPAGGPYELVVKAGDESVVVKDVLVGEVWLASGQSNMEFPLATFNLNDPLEQTDQYLAEGGVDPLLRMVTIPHQSLGTVETTIEPPLKWVKSGEDRATTREFSAVGAWFALALRKHLGVPVGIIHSSWGGTYAHAWTSREMLRRLECRKAMNARQDAVFNDAETWNIPQLEQLAQPPSNSTLPQDFDKVTRKDTGNQGFAKGWAAPEFDDSGWKLFLAPGSWMQQEVGRHGAIWARQAIEIPPEWAGLDLVLHLGGIDKHDQTYFNGELVGATGKDYDEKYWNQPREYRIPGRLVKGGRNVLAIRAFSFYFDGAFTGQPENYRLELADRPGAMLQLATEWKAKQEYEIEVFIVQSDGTAYTPFNPNACHTLFDGMIAPLIPYALRGALWYQGETDHNTMHYAREYEVTLPAMVEDWRFRWGQGDFPFYFVQISGWADTTVYDRDIDGRQLSAWCVVQDVQRRCVDAIPNSGMIAIGDVSEEHDIHPHNKRDYGKRLARLALHYTYHVPGIVPEGPRFREARPEGAALRVLFDWAEGLHALDDQPVKGFEIAGMDRKFAPAEMKIDGTSVVLTSAEVPAPLYVRYNWKPWPGDDCGFLVNGENLPCPVFCSVKVW